MTHECIPLESPGAWKDALQGIPHAFAHTWENGRAMYLSTGYRTYLYRFEDTCGRIVCPIAERGFGGYTDIVTPYGFSGFVGTAHCPDFPQYWREFARSRRYVCAYIALNPAFENTTYFSDSDAHRSNTLFYLDLTLSLDQLVANLDCNRKRQLKQKRRNLITLVSDRTLLTRFVLAHHGEFMRRVASAAGSRFTAETLRFLCGIENVFLAGAAGCEGIEAVTLFAYTPFSADYMISVPLPQGRSHATALLWHGVEQLKRLGIPLLNLGGGVREGDSVAAFKRRFGGREAPFRCLKQVYDPAVYRALCHQANVDPNQKEAYFPAFRQQ